jgi:hypothetical protein
MLQKKTACAPLIIYVDHFISMANHREQSNIAHSSSCFRLCRGLKNFLFLSVFIYDKFRKLFAQTIQQKRSRGRQNDLIACDLLKLPGYYEQFTILHSLENILLKRISDIALLLQEYKTCQVIQELMVERLATNDNVHG